nr:hypothetical protein [uncultured archaeon]CBH36663.1 hypothetical protein BSM_01400 [uncultured archaeon]
MKLITCIEIIEDERRKRETWLQKEMKKTKI